MKKVLLIVLFFFLLAQPLAADVSSKVTLADAIYADLATRQALDNVSVYYTDGKTSNDVKLNEKRHWLPASTVKTFAAMYAFRLISEGKIHLSDTVTIDSKNEVPTELVTPELPTLVTGETISIDRLIKQMITQSDNTAFNQLVDILGRDNITNYLESLGLTHSHVGSKLNLDDSQTQYEYDVQGYGINTTTAEDYAKAFMLIKNNKIPGAKDLFAILKGQKINDMIPLYLPKNVVCAHKTGDLDPLFHDGGICQDNKQSYVVTIFTNFGDPELLAHISQLLYTKDFNLVGAALNKSPIGDLPESQPIDPLISQKVLPSVLAANTLNFPTPDLTPADLGIKPNDLTLTIKDSDLPQTFIPADSPFHSLSDAWEITKKAFVLGSSARQQVDIDTAKLRLSEVKDLIKRGKTQEAQSELQTIQQGLTTLSKDPNTATDPNVQTTLEAISETRFQMLGNQIATSHGEEKLQWIKQTATVAREHIQEEGNTPIAQNAISPSQKVLTGTVVNVTNSTYTIKTPGQQIITIPNSGSVSIKPTALSQNISVSPTLTQAVTPEVSPSPTPAITVGSTIAVAGTQKGTVFAASVIVPNVPKEFTAPAPVTVAKVNLKNNTMVTIEEGVYTQVNINKDTIIKGKDTTIPLNAIQPGDVVVVHGQPLTQVTPSITLTPTTSPLLSPASSPFVSPQQENTPSPQSGGTESVSQTPTLPTTQPTTRELTPSTKQNSLVQTSPIPTPKLSPVVGKPSSQPSPTTQITPRIIQSTSIQVIEKKQDISKSSSPTTPSQPSTQPSHPQSNPQPQQNNSSQNKPNNPPQQPVQQTSVGSGKTESKKK